MYKRVHAWFEPLASGLAMLSIAIVLLGSFWWPGETSAWAAAVRYSLACFLFVVLFVGKPLQGGQCGVLGVSLVCLVCWILLSVLVFQGQEKVLRRGLIILIFIWSVVFLQTNKPELMVGLLKCTAIMGMVAAGVTLYLKSQQAGVHFNYRAFRLYDSGIEGFAAFGNPIISGMYLAFSGLIAQWAFQSAKGSAGRSLWAICWLLIVSYLFFTFSRSAWLAFGVGGVVLLLVRPTKADWLAAIGVSAVGLSLMVWLFPEMVSIELERGVTYRDLIWQMVLDSMRGHWWQGHGAGAQMSIMQIPGQTVVNTHSLYLEVLFQYGIPGLLLFVITLLAALRQLWLARSGVAALGGAVLLGCMSVMFFELHSFIHSPNLIWIWVWFPLALALASGVQLSVSGKLDDNYERS